MTMARVQLVIPDDDHASFVRQARRESLTLSAWLRAAAQDRLRRRQRARRFGTVADVEAFFADCDRLPGPEREPDWNEHLATMDRSREGHARSDDLR